MERIVARDEAEVADVVRDFAARGKSLEIVSAGSKRQLGRFTQAEAILDVSALSGIVAYEPDELVITARAATPLTEIEAALAEKKQMLAFSPVDWGPLFGADDDLATLAGIVATDASGSRALKAGRVRDHLIGCHFVNGAGEIIKAGGRVVKNVTGFDIPKLMCGAFGTLGVLTELTFRVVPKPEQVSVLTVLTRTHEEGFRLMRKAAGSPVDPTGIAYMARKSFSGEPELPNSTALAGAIFVRVEGSAAAVKDKITTLKQTLTNEALQRIYEWHGHDMFGMFDYAILSPPYDRDLWRVIVPSAAAHDVVVTSSAPAWSADCAGSQLWLGLPADAEAAKRLREITARFGGNATLIRGSEKAREELDVFEPETGARAALTRSVKAAFDPYRVLNPGRMYRDI